MWYMTACVSPASSRRVTTKNYKWQEFLSRLYEAPHTPMTILSIAKRKVSVCSVHTSQSTMACRMHMRPLL